MITQAEKKQLKALANTITTRYQIGKNEISDNLICMLDKALIAKELIKIDVLKGATDPIMEIALDLSLKLKADIVSIVGRVITLYRKNPEKQIIKLARK